jgi:hypothetical protein
MKLCGIAILLFVSSCVAAQEHPTATGIKAHESAPEFEGCVFSSPNPCPGQNRFAGRLYEADSIAQTIEMPLTAELENYEFLPVVSGTQNTVSTPTVLFKAGKWRTDKAVIASSIYEALWLTGDGITTAKLSRNAIEVGSAWAYGKHPTAIRTAGMMAAEFVGVETSSYLLQKMGAPRWLYIAPMLGSGTYHATGAIDNLRIGQ